ncbi:hypothetical protein [Gordonia sp. NB41Y]|uniref:hypothetical protein n=1 Tax=Gordonia sp. NB41Y TaxID=875808 RepID=UPI0021C8EB72|nr:hypothetical protein [Gordonia sp. NB41Y]WLP91686.1 hypothetical protein Q9K23_05385 [Gordonia sp. NB41Y]
MSPTELGCRSLFRVENDADLSGTVHQQLYSWCKAPRKGWDADKINGPGIAEVAPGVTASLVRDDRRDGSTIERWRFHQDEGHGVWITELTSFVARDRTGWVWTDVLQPQGREARVPRLVSQILEVADGLDGHHRLTATPQHAGVADVDYIYSALVDTDRRGFLFLAGADDFLAVPQEKWTGFIRKLLAGTRGLASAYVLTPEATLALNARLPESHRVREWSIRTFQPHPDLTDARDAVRHRVLTTNRIVNDTESRLRNLLARSACRQSTTTALPRELVRIDRRLRELLDDTIVGGIGHRAAGPVAAASARSPHFADPARPMRDSDIETEKAATPHPHSIPSSVTDALRSVIRSVIGTAEVTVDAVTRLGQLAADTVAQQSALKALRDRLQTVQSERNTLEDSYTEVTIRNVDGQNELAALRIELSDAQKDLRHLRGELAKLDRGEVSWVPAKVTTDDPPDNFQDLLDRVGEFTHIVFTGDPKPALELDEHNLLDWAIRTWDSLRALDDYCALRASGAFSGSVDDYVTNTPTGYATITPGSHARGETHATQVHSEFGRVRTLPVPEQVDASGKVFMGAHVRIAKYGSISPRMHYHNDATGTGKIYIGYIGRHLPNFRSN